jgi:hypothetical protein
MTYALHDQLLKSLSGTAPELRNGAPNHAPMVVEALAALGRDDDAVEWLEGNRFRLKEISDVGETGLDDRPSPLGNFTLKGWQNRFRHELDKRSWQATLDIWLPQLLPGSMAAGTHGLIRCSHAVRALENEVTSTRLEELASALTYCAARYTVMSGKPQLMGALDLETAARRLPLLGRNVDRSGPPPRIVKMLNALPDFAAAVDLLAPPANPELALSQLAELGARLYLCGASRRPLVLLHAVTGPAALQLLVRHCRRELQNIAFAYMWQAVAAWAAAFGAGLSDEPPEPCHASWDDIIELAVSSGDEHAIKLTEACHRMEASCPSPAFRVAASDWVFRVLETSHLPPAALVEAGMRTRLTD